MIGPGKRLTRFLSKTIKFDSCKLILAALVFPELF